MWLGIAVLLRPCDEGVDQMGGRWDWVMVFEAVNTVFSGNATWEEGSGL